MVTPVLKETGEDRATLASRVPLVNQESRVKSVWRVKRERSELRGRRVWPASLDATGQTDRRGRSGASALPAAKEIQETGVLMVTQETRAMVDFLEQTERREIPVDQEAQAPSARWETLDLRVREGVPARLASLEPKEHQELLEAQETRENWGEEETLGQRGPRDQTELKETRARQDLRG